MTHTSKTITSSFVLMLGLASIATQAVAGTSNNTFMESVPYTQQELTTTQGVAHVHKRIIKAARNICVGDDIRSRHLLSSKIVDQCAAEIAARALTQPKYEILASFHGSLENPGNARLRQLAKSEWTVEKFKMAQTMEEPMVDALP